MHGLQLPRCATIWMDPWHVVRPFLGGGVSEQLGVTGNASELELSSACVGGRYSCFYLTRNSLTYTAPAMVADPSLGIGITEVGHIASQWLPCPPVQWSP